MLDTAVDNGSAAALLERVERSVSALNAGDPDPMLSGYADDVEVRIPFYREDDPLGPPTIRGKSAYRDYLLAYMARHKALTVISVAPVNRGMLVTLLDGEGRWLTVMVALDAHGIGRTATVYTA
jgi:hypothetical protein